MKKRVMACVLLILFSTCGFVFATGAQEGGSEEVELEIYHFKVPWIDPWEVMEDEYEAAHPGVTLETEVVGGGADWRTLLKTKFAAGEGPDIFIIEGYSDYQLWKDYIEPLSGESWETHLMPNAKAAATFDGALMGMPLGMEGYGYIYNKDLFAAAGVKNPPMTLSELTSAAGKLKASGVTPFASGFGTWWVISNHFTNIPFAQQDDPMAFIDALNSGSASLTDNAVFQEWKSVFDLVLANCEDNPLTTDHHTQVSLLANGDAAMIQQGNWKEKVIYEAAPDLNIGLLPISFHDGPEAGRVPVGIPFFFVVNSQSSAAEVAASKEFLAWLVGTPEGQHYVTEEFKAIPAFDNIPADNLGGVSQDIIEYSKAGKTIPWMFSYWPDGAVKEFSDIAQKYVGGLLSFDEYTAELQASWDRLK